MVLLSSFKFLRETRALKIPFSFLLLAIAMPFASAFAKAGSDVQLAPHFEVSERFPIEPVSPQDISPEIRARIVQAVDQILDLNGVSERYEKSTEESSGRLDAVRRDLRQELTDHFNLASYFSAEISELENISAFLPILGLEEGSDTEALKSILYEWILQTNLEYLESHKNRMRAHAEQYLGATLNQEQEQILASLHAWVAVHIALHGDSPYKIYSNLPKDQKRLVDSIGLKPHDKSGVIHLYRYWFDDLPEGLVKQPKKQKTPEEILAERIEKSKREAERAARRVERQLKLGEESAPFFDRNSSVVLVSSNEVLTHIQAGLTDRILSSLARNNGRIPDPDGLLVEYLISQIPAAIESGEIRMPLEFHGDNVQFARHIFAILVRERQNVDPRLRGHLESLNVRAESIEREKRGRPLTDEEKSEIRQITSALQSVALANFAVGNRDVGHILGRIYSLNEEWGKRASEWKLVVRGTANAFGRDWYTRSNSTGVWVLSPDFIAEDTPTEVEGLRLAIERVGVKREQMIQFLSNYGQRPRYFDGQLLPRSEIRKLIEILLDSTPATPAEFSRLVHEADLPKAMRRSEKDSFYNLAKSGLRNMYEQRAGCDRVLGSVGRAKLPRENPNRLTTGIRLGVPQAP